MKDGFVIPAAKPGETVPFCQFLNMKGGMKPCTCDPKNCSLGFLVRVSKEGTSAPTTSEFNDFTQVMAETLEHCPRIHKPAASGVQKVK
jgi:hypothetical protein